MSSPINQLFSIQKSYQQEIEKALTIQDIEKVRLAFLGKQGALTNFGMLLKEVSAEQKKEIFPLLGNFKEECKKLCDDKKEMLIQKEAQEKELKEAFFDVTCSLPRLSHGSLHPYSYFIEEIENIFLSMGYDFFSGPEVETDYYNFTALNIGPEHPARDMYDTLWLNRPNLLLRTHTSSVQARAMKIQKPPIALCVAGRVFRHEAVDASHDVAFMQCEGIVIDKNISLAHLFGTAQTFLRTLFGKQHLDIRTRPGHFPFVEPGVEIDVRCPFCVQGCNVCKKSTWIEIFPGGLIHPKVLLESGIDPTIYSGFAFGFGLTRLAMLTYGINDVRLLHSPKVDFLSQF